MHNAGRLVNASNRDAEAHKTHAKHELWIANMMSEYTNSNDVSTNHLLRFANPVNNGTMTVE